MKTLKDMLAEARQVIPEQGPAEVELRLRSTAPPVMIDVRNPDEYRDGHIEEAPNADGRYFRLGTMRELPAVVASLV